MRVSRQETENTHWWFVGRRAILASLSKFLPPGPRLEIGCGYYGGAGLSDNQAITVALDMELAKLEAIKERHAVRAVCATAGQLPFPGESFASCLMLDVLEHLRNDWLALVETCRVLRPGGRALITVPAFPSLWSAHDEAEMHLRRYRLSDLRRLCDAAGLRVIKSGHFNTLLFPAALLWRFVSRRLYRSRTPKDDFHVLPRPLNQLLALMLGAERSLVAQFPLPFGLSAFVVVEKS